MAMPESPLSDLDINRNVRKILIRHRIDLGWLSVSSCRGAVRIHGKFQRIPGADVQLNPNLMSTIFEELRRHSGSRRIAAELQNWTHDGSLRGWVPRADISPKIAADLQPSGPQTFHI